MRTTRADPSDDRATTPRRPRRPSSPPASTIVTIATTVPRPPPPLRQTASPRGRRRCSVDRVCEPRSHRRAAPSNASTSPARPAPVGTCATSRRSPTSRRRRPGARPPRVPRRRPDPHGDERDVEPRRSPRLRARVTAGHGHGRLLEPSPAPGRAARRRLPRLGASTPSSTTCASTAPASTSRGTPTAPS